MFVAYQNPAALPAVASKVLQGPDQEDAAEEDDRRSQGSDTSRGSNDSFDAETMQKGAQSQGTGGLNAFISAYLVPMVKAKNKVQDVQL